MDKFERDKKNVMAFYDVRRWPGDNVWASIDIFRLDDNSKVVEHWEVLQKVYESSANDNTMF
jgi:predicted SnoaL-like aldol condensation-catalyzing enzyme